MRTLTLMQSPPGKLTVLVVLMGGESLQGWGYSMPPDRFSPMLKLPKNLVFNQASKEKLSLSRALVTLDTGPPSSLLKKEPNSLE